MTRTNLIKSGIYRITCLGNKKFYIGSAVNLKRRFDEHQTLLRNNKHYNSKLQHAWNKYGEEQFIFDIVELVDEEYLLDCEQTWMDSTNVCVTGFNLAQKAGSGGSCRDWIITYPDGTEKLLSNMTKFARENNLNAGALAEVAKGHVNHHKNFKIRYAHQTKEEWTKTLVRSNKFGHGWKGKYLVITPSGEELIIDSLNEFCVKNNLSQGNMASICRGERKQHKGYTAQFII